MNSGRDSSGFAIRAPYSMEPTLSGRPAPPAAGVTPRGTLAARWQRTGYDALLAALTIDVIGLGEPGRGKLEQGKPLSVLLASEEYGDDER